MASNLAALAAGAGVAAAQPHCQSRKGLALQSTAMETAVTVAAAAEAAALAFNGQPRHAARRSRALPSGVPPGALPHCP